MKKVLVLLSIAIVLGLVIGCPHANDGNNDSGNGGGGETIYVKPADETISIDDGNGGTVEMQMIGIKGGNFSMGNADETILPIGSARPVHPVTLNSFYLGSTEVTEAQWEAVMGSWPNYDPETEDSYGSSAEHPARYISWNDAIKFCNQLSINEELEHVYYIGESYPETANIHKDTNLTKAPNADFTKNGYRLPTEAEWEYAAGGAQETPTTWAGTGDENSLVTYAVYSTSNPSTVGSKNPVSKTYSLFDLSGNVWEWCWDWYGANYYSENGNNDNPKGPDSGLYRAIRGGGWGSGLPGVRVAQRFSDFYPPEFNRSTGFRVAQSVSP